MHSITMEAAKCLIACYRNKVIALPDLHDADDRIVALSNIRESDALIRMLRMI